MAIKPVCDRCGKELDDFGALLFSPPDEISNVKKSHLCKKCYRDMIRSFRRNQKD